jgi:amino acid transporter
MDYLIMLKRDISTSSVLIVAAGSMIGSGWLFSPFISAQIAGPAALISWILVAIFMVFIALPLCELGTIFPMSGGMSNYPTITHGKEVGFLYAWTTWLSFVVMTPIEIQAVLQYGSYFFPSLIDQTSPTFHLTYLGYGCAFIILSAVTLLNTLGIKFVAECGKYAGLIKFLLPSIAIFSLLYVGSHHEGFNNLSLEVSHHLDWKNIFSALSIGGVAFAFTGFQNGLVLAGELKHPQRDIPLAVLGAVAIGFVLYFLLQLSFIVAMPEKYLAQGWHHLVFPGMSTPLVGLTLLLGLGFVAVLLLIDSSFSPLGTALIYTTATSRILYGMAEQKHLPAVLLKLNKNQIPYVTLIVNFIVGMLTFLPFPGWQKMVAFLSSASILSYSIGPICLMALRKLQPKCARPFKLAYASVICYLSFYFSSLMLQWCGFSVIWKLYIALFVGLLIHFAYQKKPAQREKLIKNRSLHWFLLYITTYLIFSYLGPFGGIGVLKFPYDMILLIPVSFFVFYLSQKCLSSNYYVSEIEEVQLSLS